MTTEPKAIRRVTSTEEVLIHTWLKRRERDVIWEMTAQDLATMIGNEIGIDVTADIMQARRKMWVPKPVPRPEIDHEVRLSSIEAALKQITSRQAAFEIALKKQALRIENLQTQGVLPLGGGE